LIHFLSIALASLSELDTQAEIAVRLGHLSDRQLHNKIEEVSALTIGLRNSLRRKSKEP
jgi:four helix bundle protein